MICSRRDPSKQCMQGSGSLGAPIHGTKRQVWLRLCDHELMRYERKAQDAFLTQRRWHLKSVVKLVAPQTLAHTDTSKPGGGQTTSTHTLVSCQVVRTVLHGESTRCTSAPWTKPSRATSDYVVAMLRTFLLIEKRRDNASALTKGIGDRLFADMGDRIIFEAHSQNTRPAEARL